MDTQTLLEQNLSLAFAAQGESLAFQAEEGELARLREMGRDLVNFVFMSTRTLALHASDNVATIQPLERLAEVLAQLELAVHRTHFITVEGQIYLNDLRIKMEVGSYTNVQYLVNLLDRHGIGGITFSRALPVEDIKALMLLLLNTVPPKDDEELTPLQAIRQALEEADIPDVDFDQPYFFKASDAFTDAILDEELAEQHASAVAYSKGILAVKDYFRAVEAAEAANPLRIRKIIHDLVDVAESDPADFLKLHTVHGVEDPYYNHSVNVATLAISIGRELQLSRVELADLGSAAMFHDLGYSVLERDAGEVSKQWTDEERMRLHPIAGFKSLMKQGEYGPGLLRRLLVMLEHHMHYDRQGGYPKLGDKRLTVYTRILQVADHYDALVTSTGGRPGLLPVKALERVIASSGSAFDPVVVKALVNVVGRYPYGSLVRLSTQEVGVVTSGARTEQAFLHPRVMVVRNADASECNPREVDLFEDRLLRRKVEQVLNPYNESVVPHAVLFDQLDESGDETQEAAGEADAWSDAIARGEDPEEILARMAQEQGFELPTPSEPEPEGERELEPWEKVAPEAASSTPSKTRRSKASEKATPRAPADAAAGRGSDDAGTFGSVVDLSVPPIDLPPEEVAARKAAWRKAMSEAWARGGEAAVRSLAARHWYDFDPSETGD